VRNFRRLRPAEQLHWFAVTAVELPRLGGNQPTLLLGKCDDLRSVRKRAVMRVRRRGGIWGSPALGEPCAVVFSFLSKDDKYPCQNRVTHHTGSLSKRRAEWSVCPLSTGRRDRTPAA
jgi:hypothetical protein